MRWIPYLLLIWVGIAVQMTLGKVLTFERLGIGPVGPDLMVAVAVFMALNVRHRQEAMLSGWALGMMLDLTTAGGAPCVGPMAIAYMIGSWMVFSLREAVYRDSFFPLMVVSLVFAFISHSIWVTVQAIFSEGEFVFSAYGRMLLQVFVSALYTALLGPLIYFMVSGLRGVLLVSSPSGRRSRVG